MEEHVFFVIPDENPSWRSRNSVVRANLWRPLTRQEIIMEALEYAEDGDGNVDLLALKSLDLWMRDVARAVVEETLIGVVTSKNDPYYRKESRKGKRW